MTNSFPCRRIILQLSQIRFTLERTFMGYTLHAYSFEERVFIAVSSRLDKGAEHFFMANSPINHAKSSCSPADYRDILTASRPIEELPMSAAILRDEAHRLVDQLPDDATWDDLLYRIYVHQSIEAGLEDCRAGRLVPVEEVRRRLGLPT